MKLLWIALVWCSTLGAEPFSHRLHLQMNLQCVGCHVAARNSTKVEDNLLPAKEVCLACHKESEIQIPAPETTRIVNFSHAQHLKMGNLLIILTI